VKDGRVGARGPRIFIARSSLWQVLGGVPVWRILEKVNGGEVAGERRDPIRRLTGRLWRTEGTKGGCDGDIPSSPLCGVRLMTLKVRLLRPGGERWWRKIRFIVRGRFHYGGSLPSSTRKPAGLPGGPGKGEREGDLGERGALRAGTVVCTFSRSHESSGTADKVPEEELEIAETGPPVREEYVGLKIASEDKA